MAGYSADVKWPVDCIGCARRGEQLIRKYPHTKTDLRLILSGGVKCSTSCSGTMHVRKHEERRFLFVYGTLIRNMGVFVKR